MDMTQSETERLDLVARSKVDSGIISYSRIALLLLAPLALLLAANSTAPFLETILVATLGAAGLVTALILWVDWRYKVYTLSLFCFTFALCDLLSHDHPHSQTLLGWIGAHALLPLFLYYGCGLMVIAGRYALVNGNGYVKERSQVELWLEILKRQGDSNVAEFPTGSFWTGYWTYRFLNPGACWIVGKFKRGGSKLRGCHVHKLSDIAFVRLASGRWRVEILTANKTMAFDEVEIAPPGFDPIKGRLNA